MVTQTQVPKIHLRLTSVYPDVTVSSSEGKFPTFLFFKPPLKSLTTKWNKLVAKLLSGRIFTIKTSGRSASHELKICQICRCRVSTNSLLRLAFLVGQKKNLPKTHLGLA